MCLFLRNSTIKSTRIYIYITFLTFFFIKYHNVFATLPPTPPYNNVWSDPNEIFRPYYQLDLRHRQIPRRDIDNYIGQFQLICEFLDVMQEHNQQNPNYGGLHEGEGPQLWAIVETDNTQEAIRVWCLYAEFFNQPELYRNNVEAAWTYCDSFPAWEESEPGEMYGLHNAGWGLVAEMAYRRVYGDGRRFYGLLCAQHIIEHTPEITPEMQDVLMPLVAGWVAGTLYLYGELENNETFKQNALRIASQVKNWIDFRPSRLNNNEIWALCGGTAMWGVLNSIGRDDSSNTARWAIERLQQMDVFAGRGNWNNSWNIWYAHAWYSAFNRIGNPDYRANAIAIVDSLIKQDRDRDGGIPATIGDGDNRDQSWVTAYTGWMGLWNNFDALPDINLKITRLVSPNNTRPLPEGTPFEFSFEFQQQGRLENVFTIFLLSGYGNNRAYGTMINGWQPIVWTLPESIAFTPGQYSFTAVLYNPDEFDRTDDTLRFGLEILPISPVTLTARGNQGDNIGCKFKFYNMILPEDEPPIEVALTNRIIERTINLMIGEYRILVEPDFPYANKTICPYQIEADNRYRIDLVFEQPSVLLVNNSEDTTFTIYYTSALEALNYTYRLWNTNEDGILNPQISRFNTVIYFSGNRTNNTIGVSDSEQLQRFNNGGGNIFITGQNISDEFNRTDFLRDVLHCYHLADNVRRNQALGVLNDPITSEHNYLLIGNRGANNQTSPSGIAPFGNGIACMVYPERPDTFAGVRWILPSGGKGVFLAFGFEGISGQGGTTPRDTLMAAIFRWFNVPQNIESHSDYSKPISYDIITTYPNPFNNYINITIPTLGFNIINDIFILDNQGRLVNRLKFNEFGKAVWDGRNLRNEYIGSGCYFILLNGVKNGFTISKRIVYIK